MRESRSSLERVTVRRGPWGKPVLRPRWAPLWRPFVWHRGAWGRWLWVSEGLLLLFGATAHKLHRDDVDRIELETGRAANGLTEDELLAAMGRLAIGELGLTDVDRKASAAAE